MKDITVADLCSINQDALVDDWINGGESPERTASILAAIQLYDGGCSALTG